VAVLSLPVLSGLVVSAVAAASPVVVFNETAVSGAFYTSASLSMHNQGHPVVALIPNATAMFTSSVGALTVASLASSFPGVGLVTSVGAGVCLVVWLRVAETTHPLHQAVLTFVPLIPLPHSAPQ
jgi:hypothetical protein